MLRPMPDIFSVFSKYNRASPHLRLPKTEIEGKHVILSPAVAEAPAHSASRNDVSERYQVKMNHLFVLCSILCKNQERALQHDSGYGRSSAYALLC